jgi:hypothetical protein
MEVTVLCACSCCVQHANALNGVALWQNMAQSPERVKIDGFAHKAGELPKDLNLF